MKTKALFGSRLVLVCMALGWGACSKPTPPSPAGAPGAPTNVPPGPVAGTSPQPAGSPKPTTVVPDPLAQLSQEFAREQALVAEATKPGDAAVAQWDQLVAQPLTNPAFRPLATPILTSYRQALPHMWTMRAINQLGQTLASGKTRDTLLKDAGLLTEMFDRAKGYMFTAWQVNKGFQERPKTEHDRTVRMQALYLVLASEWSRVNAARIQAEQSAKELDGMVQLKAHHALAVQAKASLTKESYVALQNDLWSARLPLQVLMSYYKEVPADLMKQNEQINAMLDSANLGLAIAQGIFSIQDPMALTKAMQEIHARKDAVDKTIAALLPAAEAKKAEPAVKNTP